MHQSDRLPCGHHRSELYTATSEPYCDGCHVREELERVSAELTVCRELLRSTQAARDAAVHYAEDERNKLRSVVEAANNELFDALGDDVAHILQSHAGNVPYYFRKVSAGAQKALDILQTAIQGPV